MSLHKYLWFSKLPTKENPLIWCPNSKPSTAAMSRWERQGQRKESHILAWMHFTYMSLLPKSYNFGSNFVQWSDNFWLNQDVPIGVTLQEGGQQHSFWKIYEAWPVCWLFCTHFIVKFASNLQWYLKILSQSVVLEDREKVERHAAL